MNPVNVDGIYNIRAMAYIPSRLLREEKMQITYYVNEKTSLLDQALAKVIFCWLDALASLCQEGNCRLHFVRNQAVSDRCGKLREAKTATKCR